MFLNRRQCYSVERRWRRGRGEIRWCDTIAFVIRRNWRYRWSLLQIDLIVVDDQIGHLLADVTQLFIIVWLAQVQCLLVAILTSLFSGTQRIVLVGFKCREYWIHLWNDSFDWVIFVMRETWSWGNAEVNWFLMISYLAFDRYFLLDDETRNSSGYFRFPICCWLCYKLQHMSSFTPILSILIVN